MRLQSKGFTLVELLVVLAVISILAVVIVVVLNPAELLKQARDSTRLNDLGTINQAVNLYNLDVIGGTGKGTLGNPSTT